MVLISYVCIQFQCTFIIFGTVWWFVSRNIMIVFTLILNTNGPYIWGQEITLSRNKSAFVFNFNVQSFVIFGDSLVLSRNIMIVFTSILNTNGPYIWHWNYHSVPNINNVCIQFHCTIVHYIWGLFVVLVP